jgi:hypothetical protein
MPLAMPCNTLLAASEYKFKELVVGLAVLLDIEMDTHRWVVRNLTKPRKQGPLDQTLAFKYLEKLFPYVTKQTIVIEESEFNPAYRNRKYITLSEHPTTMSLYQSVQGLMLLVNQIAAADLRVTDRDTAKAKLLIRFAWDAYIRYRLDSFLLPRYTPDERLSEQVELPLLSYEELAFFSRRTIGYIEKDKGRGNFKNVTPAKKAKVWAYGNDVVNEAVGVSVIPYVRRRAFVEVDSALSWLGCRYDSKSHPYRPTQLTSKNHAVASAIPKYWQADYWPTKVEQFASSNPNNQINLSEAFVRIAGINEQHLAKLKKGKSSLSFGQARMLDLYFSEKLPKRDLDRASIFPFLSILD